VKTASISLGKTKLELKVGNIALSDADAIVNAANEYLNLGSGVAGAIREAGGSTIQNECNEIGFCPVGSAVITGGGTLKAKYVIHAVGPMYGEGNEDEKLRSAVTASCELAEKKGLKSIVFPAIGAGYFHFPVSECAKVIIGAIKDSASNFKTLDHVTICLKTDKKFEVFEKELNA